MSVTVLNIGSHTAKALALSGSKARRREIELPPGTIRNGLVLQPEAVSAQLKTLFKSGGFSGERVVCTVNGMPFSYRMLTIPRVAPAAFHEAVARTAKREMSISPDEMYLSWQAYPADNNEWQVLVTGITRHPVDTLIKTLSGAGIRPWLLDLPHLALARLSPQDDAIIVDFENDCSNIVLMVDGVPRGMHMVPAFANGASLQDRITQVTDRLGKMVEFYNGGHPAKPIGDEANVLVTGELLDDEKALGIIQSQAGYQVSLLTIDGKAFSGWPLNRFAVNAGAARLDAQLERDTGKDAVPRRYFNLEKIVKESRPRTDIRKTLKKAWVPVALVAGIGLLAFSYLSQSQLRASIMELEAQTTMSNLELQQKQALADDAMAVKNSIDEITSRIESIIAGRNEILEPPDYISDISSIVASMPPGLTFNSLDITPGGIFLKGVGYEASLVVQFAGNLETTGGFSRAVINMIDRPHKLNEQEEQALNFSIVISR